MIRPIPDAININSLVEINLKKFLYQIGALPSTSPNFGSRKIFSSNDVLDSWLNLSQDHDGFPMDMALELKQTNQHRRGNHQVNSSIITDIRVPRPFQIKKEKAQKRLQSLQIVIFFTPRVTPRCLFSLPSE